MPEVSPKSFAEFFEIKDYYLGFHRLSINGLNSESNQPFIKNGVYVICNGEIYNYKELYNYIGINMIFEFVHGSCL